MIAKNIFLAFLVSFLIAAVLSRIFDCAPFADFLVVKAGKLAQPQKCANLDKLNISLAAIHIATDFTLLSVPLIVLYKMQMSKTKKKTLPWLPLFRRLCFLYRFHFRKCGLSPKPTQTSRGLRETSITGSQSISSSQSPLHLSLFSTLPYLRAGVNPTLSNYCEI